MASSSSPPKFLHTSESLLYVATHVFLPVNLPDKNDYSPENNQSLARAISSAAHAYATQAHMNGTPEEAQWHLIARMLSNLQASLEPEHLGPHYIISQLREMRTGDILAFFIQSRNAAIILTKRQDVTLCQAFEVSPSEESFTALPGPLICSYPGSSVELSNEVVFDVDFQSELAKLLSREFNDDPAAVLPSPADPQYINELLNHVLRSVENASGISCPSNHAERPFGTGCGIGRTLPRITKHVRDHIGVGDAPWRRSPLLVLSKVVIQLSVINGSLARSSYKRFWLYFMCTLALDESNTDLPSGLLHLMSSTVLRRLSKLCTSSCDWLSELAMKTWTRPLEILDTRREQLGARRSPFQNPSTAQLTRDMQLSLSISRDYIRKFLRVADHEPELVITPFHPSQRRRGNIADFLSSDGTFFDEAYASEPGITLYDVERLVEEGIDDWLACVNDVDEACAQLECLMDKYSREAHMLLWYSDPEHVSIRLLTMLELYVALDKLVVEKIPMLADYPPPFPVALLEYMLLRGTTSLHRLSCAYQYLAMRHCQSHPGWSAISSEFNEDSFPVRYYDQSQDLQQLKARIEDDVMKNVRQSGQSPLPTLPSHAKVVVFELQCPPCFRIWRSAMPRILCCLNSHVSESDTQQKYDLLANIPAFKSYFVGHKTSHLDTEIHFAYFHSVSSQSPHSPTFRYIVQHTRWTWGTDFSIWPPEEYCNSLKPSPLGYRIENLDKYMDRTSHMPNDVLSAQADCPAGLSLDEFITFAQLRSGGHLQWPNILQGLRSRTLNLRRHQVHFLLSHTVYQVGPLDLNTGTWAWHQELQDTSLCNALLDELEGSLTDVKAGLMDCVLMNTISLLLIRVFGSSPGENISNRALTLLRIVRKKTFNWVQELSYDLVMEPTNEKRINLMRDMAATCRSAFEVDPASHFHSSEDVDALLSCAFFISTLHSHNFRYMKTKYPEVSHYSRLIHQSKLDQYSKLLLQRDSRLALVLEQSVRDAVFADASDYGIDLAAGKIFARYRPGTRRWNHLQHPNARWFTCETAATVDQPLQNVLIDLLDGAVRVDGQPVGGLPDEIRNIFYRQLFRGQGFFVIPSDLPGMDFMTLATTSEYKVHFTLREGDFALRAEGAQANDILTLIPSGLLFQDLPPAFVYDKVHWLNSSTKTIEIRPIERPWTESPDNWRIHCASEYFSAYRGRETLVDTRSSTAAMVSNCFKRLVVNKLSSDEPMITVSSTDSAPFLRLSVTLSRYSLFFFVNDEGELESLDFKDMVYDEDQSVGALLGLESLLVLRPKTHIAGTLVPNGFIPRRLLIPNGQLEGHGDNQIRVDSFDKHCFPGDVPADEPPYHTYIEDTDLGCLTGDGSITSTEFLARLHAMTSRHRPDPLTGKTGAQVALDLLRSAVCQSIMEYKTLSDDFLTSTGYPQINAAYNEIASKYYWDPLSRIRKTVTWSAGEKRAARRAGYIFPSNAACPLADSRALGNGSTRDGSDYFKSPSPQTRNHIYPVTLPCMISSLRYIFDAGVPTQITLGLLMCNRPAPQLPAHVTFKLPRARRECYRTSLPATNITPTLVQLISSLPTDSSFQREYISHLDASAQHAQIEWEVPPLAREDLVNALKEHFVRCRIVYMDSLDIIKHRLDPTSDPCEQAHYYFGQWPPITAHVLLSHLASTSQTDVGTCWKDCLTSLALHLLELQRSRRLLRFALAGLKEELWRELENEGCDGWSPKEHPDWLLIQIQGNFLIRRSQAEAAMEVVSPRSRENTVMQLSIGEGKSSVIIPIAATALANGKQLVRVIAPKALTMQMFELLVSRLGGLANRPIYYLPYSRTPHLDRFGQLISPQIYDLHRLMRLCMKQRGILLMQPEHAVSLKLMGVEEQLRKGQLPEPKQAEAVTNNAALLNLKLPRALKDSIVGRAFQRAGQSPVSPSQSRRDHPTRAKTDARHQVNEVKGSTQVAVSNLWLSLQTWMEAHVRDILDESDEILHSRFSLIYTLGCEQHVDGYPHRWTIIQQVLRLVKKHVCSLSSYSPDCIQCEFNRPGSFPYIRITRAADIYRRLKSLITKDVMTAQLPDFDFRHLSPALHDAIRAFISDESILQIPDTERRVKEYVKALPQSHLWSGLLLLRGLLTSNILSFALSERRWRVDYGLCPDLRYREHDGRPIGQAPTMLAIPYRAKDTPAPNCQFGHPDVTILLTCLSYYYTGLSSEQLRACFEILLDQDGPSTEYAIWMKEYHTVPDTLRNLSEINLASQEQWDKVIFPFLSWNKATIDYYLSRVVFPKEAKQFPWKLTASSWDLAEKRDKLITGFSGTNDGKWLLPMSIAQRDSDHQKGTNATLLARLLRPENSFYMVSQEDDKPWNTRAFLRLVAQQQPEIRVLLDVGSQILDLSNREVATVWLEITRDAGGAIYFSNRDELMILTRNGSASPLISSAFSRQLDRCVVYLDHAHTRGTDIKFPIGSRAAVTLGPKVTKDALVQGCMRMRQLGHGHSVMFFAPPAVDWCIRVASRKTDLNCLVTTVDILCWAIHETCADIQQRATYWAQQGMSHKTRHHAWSRFCDNNISQEQLVNAWLQPEKTSLEDLYAPETENMRCNLRELDPEIRQRCKILGALSLPKAQMDEEQEREVHREQEREREVELPPKAEPADHFLHPDVVSFVKTGIIPPLHSSSAFCLAFTELSKSFVAACEADVWSPFILATADFCRTIKLESTLGTMDQYLRPVQWVLSGGEQDCKRVLVLLSPFEADRLLPDIRVSKHVHLHLYVPRTSQGMKPADDLKLYCVPPLPSDWTPPWNLIDQLNVFAGQLYLRDYATYLRLCHFLDVPTKQPSNADGTTIGRNLFQIPGSFEEMEITFSGSPLPSVMAFLAIRTRGKPFAHTHMGRILQGQLLTEKDFQP